MIPVSNQMLDTITKYVKSKLDIKTNRMAIIDPSFDLNEFPDKLPRVVFDGESTPSGKGYNVIGNYTPIPGDRVLMMPVGKNYVISGSPTSMKNPLKHSVVFTDLFDISVESTSSTSFVELATPGPEVTLYTGRNALVFINCQLYGNGFTTAGVKVSGASDIGPSDPKSLTTEDGTRINGSKTVFFDNLTAGYNTFELRYKTNNTEGNFVHRQIGVMPL